MRKTMRKMLMAAVCTLCLLLASCGAQRAAETPETVTKPAKEFENEESLDEESQKDETAKEETSEPKSDAPVREIVIDFPFSYDMEEGCTLTLACMDELL